MTVIRLFAIIVIFCAASAAWLVLGGSMEYRTAERKDSLSREVTSLWGPPDLVQHAPYVVPGQDDRTAASRYVDPIGGDVQVDFEHANRYKGLLWFSTYTARFDAVYRVTLPSPGAGAGSGGLFIFRLPGREVEKIRFELDGAEYQAAYSDSFSNTALVRLPGDSAEHAVRVAYEVKGRDSWVYRATWDDLDRPAGLKDFTLTATMNFADLDYPKGSVSPTAPAVKHNGGRQAVWKYDTDRTTKWMGIVMPARPNAGPIAARMSFFAPVSLFFFFTTLFTVVALKKTRLHPMHYLFISAGFFAFHILLAYLVEKVSIHKSFWICAGVSVVLVVSYMRLVAGVKFALVYVGAAQLVYLLGFSYAFFFPGWTGLTIVIGAILTLFVLMQATGRLNWDELFPKKPTPERPWAQEQPSPETPLPPLPVSDEQAGPPDS